MVPSLSPVSVSLNGMIIRPIRVILKVLSLVLGTKKAFGKLELQLLLFLLLSPSPLLSSLKSQRWNNREAGAEDRQGRCLHADECWRLQGGCGCQGGEREEGRD